MLCPVLVSRSTELRGLTSALDRAQEGAGGVIFLAGEAGVGKSRLAREISALAAARGLHVLIGRATESVAPVPFRPIAEVLMKVARGGVVPDAPEMADFRAALGSLVPQWSQPGDAAVEISPLMLGEALIRLLSRPGPKGVLLVLEDLHWADPETLAIVEYLADNLADTNLLAVATVRDSESSPGLDTIRSISARRAATTVEVRRLHDSAVEKMARACLDTDDVPGEMLSLLADCDGLPFAVEEVLAAAVTSGQLVSEPAGWRIDSHIAATVPVSIVGSVRNRLAVLRPQAADVLACAAVLGRMFDWTLLPDISHLDEPEVLAALREARDVQLIESVPAASGMFRFRHSLTRHAILSCLLPPDLARRSAAAAAAIENAYPGLPGSWCELAAELHETAGDQVRAAALLLEVGGRALKQGAVGSAAESLRDARTILARATPDDRALAIDIDEELVTALTLAGDVSELGTVVQEAIARLQADGSDLQRQARILLMAARAESEVNPAAAAGHLSTARAIAGRARHPVTSAWVDAIAARCAIDAGDLETADELAHSALAVAESAGLHGWAADVAFETLEIIGRRERLRDIGAARAAFERAYQLCGDKEFAVRRIRALHELGTIDMLEDGSTARLCQAKDLASKAGAISTTSMIDLQLANTWSLGTDTDRALAAARQCEHGASRIRARKVEAIAINIQALVAAIRADRIQTDLIAERAERILPGDPEVLFSTWGLARVTASLFHDDLPRALEESEAGLSYGGDAAMNSPRRAWGNYAILQAVFGKDARAAIRYARAAGAAVGWNDGYLRYAEAVVEGREGRPDRATALAAQGGVLLAPYAPWWNHLARRLVAPAALRDGWGDPVAWLRGAAAGFDESRHPRVASACRGLLRRAGERVPRSGRGSAQIPAQLRRLGITSREMDVFLLVARGFSNAEIAERLFISPKTVQTHIASLVAKTGQTGRRELVAHAAQVAPS